MCSLSGTYRPIFLTRFINRKEWTPLAEYRASLRNWDKENAVISTRRTKCKNHFYFLSHSLHAKKKKKKKRKLRVISLSQPTHKGIWGLITLLSTTLENARTYCFFIFIVHKITMIYFSSTPNVLKNTTTCWSFMLRLLKSATTLYFSPVLNARLCNVEFAFVSLCMHGFHLDEYSLDIYIQRSFLVHSQSAWAKKKTGGAECITSLTNNKKKVSRWWNHNFWCWWVLVFCVTAKHLSIERSQCVEKQRIDVYVNQRIDDHCHSPYGCSNTCQNFGLHKQLRVQKCFARWFCTQSCKSAQGKWHQRSWPPTKVCYVQSSGLTATAIWNLSRNLQIQNIIAVKFHLMNHL